MDEEVPPDNAEKWKYDLNKTIAQQPDTLFSFFQSDQLLSTQITSLLDPAQSTVPQLVQTQPPLIKRGASTIFSSEVDGKLLRLNEDLVLASQSTMDQSEGGGSNETIIDASEH